MVSRNPNGRPSRGGVARETSSVRLPVDLRTKLREQADELGLSFVEHVENILQQHFDGPALADAIAERLEARLSDSKIIKGLTQALAHARGEEAAKERHIHVKE